MTAGQILTSFLGLMFLLWASHTTYLLYVNLQEGNLSITQAGYNLLMILIIITIVFVILS